MAPMSAINVLRSRYPSNNFFWSRKNLSNKGTNVSYQLLNLFFFFFWYVNTSIVYGSPSETQGFARELVVNQFNKTAVAKVVTTRGSNNRLCKTDNKLGSHARLARFTRLTNRGTLLNFKTARPLVTNTSTVSASGKCKRVSELWWFISLPSVRVTITQYISHTSSEQLASRADNPQI
jgi:hypothetical protein